MYMSTKYFKEIGPCAYRNWKSDTECYLIHGYDRSFKFVFGCNTLDSQGFVVDFGGLKDVKRQLEDWFDHTVILQSDDPIVYVFEALEKAAQCRLRTFPSISCEGLAEYVGEYVDCFVTTHTAGRAWVESCEMIEAEKNSAIYYPRLNSERMAWEDYIEADKILRESSGRLPLDL